MEKEGEVCQYHKAKVAATLLDWKLERRLEKEETKSEEAPSSVYGSVVPTGANPQRTDGIVSQK